MKRKIKKSSAKHYNIRRSRVAYEKGPIRVVDSTIAMPEGTVLSRQILEHPGSVVIIPRAARDRFILIRQFRYAAGGWLWEWPAGGVKTNETLKAAARREMMEETDLKPARLTFLVRFYPSPGVSDEMMHLFLAEGLKPGSLPGDEDEDIEVREFSRDRIRDMICKGQVRDAKTLLGFLWLEQNAEKLSGRKK